MTDAGNSRDKLVLAIPLSRSSALSLGLAPDSRFTTHLLAEYIATQPDLAFTTRDKTNQYIVGGFWRQRDDIGAILELFGTAHRRLLAERLIGAFHLKGCKLLVIDPREQERNGAFFEAMGFSTVETLIQMERAISDIAATMPVTIREMEERDVGAVLGVEKRSFPWLWWNSERELRWYASIPGVELYVAEAASHIVAGYAGFTIYERQAHLDRLAVHADFQHSGFGSALLVHSLHQMYKKGAKRVALTTQLSNTISQKLYNKFGFKDSGWRHDLLGIWLH